LESLSIGESVRQVYFTGRTRRHGNRRRYHPHQPEIVVQPPIPAYEPPKIIPLIDSSPEQDLELELSPEEKLFLERRMDVVQTLAETAITEAQQLEDAQPFWDTL
jgi:hypothetical protein